MDDLEIARLVRMYVEQFSLDAEDAERLLHLILLNMADDEFHFFSKN